MPEVTGETVNQEHTTENVEQEHEVETFTQDDVNRIVDNRLQRERAKYADIQSNLDKANKKASELQAEVDQMKSEKAIAEIRAKVSKKTGVPSELLTGSDEASCKEQAEAILAFAKGSKYPGIKETGHNTKPVDASENEYHELAGQIFGRKDK